MSYSPFFMRAESAPPRLQTSTDGEYHHDAAPAPAPSPVLAPSQILMPGENDATGSTESLELLIPPSPR